MKSTLPLRSSPRVRAMRLVVALRQTCLAPLGLVATLAFGQEYFYSYQDGETNLGALTDTVLNVANGSATQSGLVAGYIHKTGAGTLTITNLANSIPALSVTDGTLILQNTYVNAPTSLVQVSGSQSVLRLSRSDLTTGYLFADDGGTLDFTNFLGGHIELAGDVALGSSSTLNINSRGVTLVAENLYSNGSNNRITLGGFISTYDFADTIGLYDPGTIFTIQGGAYVTSAIADIGVGNQVTVTGSRSGWGVRDILILGDNDDTTSDSASLTVEAGARVSAGTWVLGNGIGCHGTLNLGAYDLTNPTTAGTVTGSITFGSGSGGNINFNQTDATVFASNLFGTGAMMQRGTGTTTVSGGNSFFSGTTTVEAGTLIAANDTAFGSSTITVHGGTLNVGGYTLGNTITLDGGALAGTGTLTGAVSLGDGAHLAPGNSPGTLTFTNGLSLNGGAILDFELGSSSDLIRVSGGTLTGPASGLVTLNLTNSGGFAPATYVLFDFTGATLNSFDVTDFTLGTTIAGYDYAFNLTATSLELIATASAIPEPSAYAIFAGLAALGLVAIRRRAAP